MIVAVYRHLEVEAGELGEMSVRVRVLGAEDGTDLEDAFHVCGDAHLLRELRALCEIRRAAEIVDLENGGAGLC